VTFVDTSALLAFLDRDATHHEQMVEALGRLLAERAGVTHNYVVIETEALVHRRHGAGPARRLLQDILPLLEIAWITPELHTAAVDAHLADLRRRTSLVDHTSFVLMRARDIRHALALDRHFAEAGFTVSPS
jgi:predicted nucleic acid-binding protein